MKIAILNVKYSPNLGDGVIAEVIEHQLAKHIPNANIFSIDIGGMDDYGSGGSIMGKGMGLMSKVKKLPSFIQQPIKNFLVPIAVERKYAAGWQKQLRGTKGVVIGGGHLFMDVDQYFPMRILSALRQAPANVRVAVYAVGVSKKMTPRGLTMFKNILSTGKLVQTAVRDVQSQKNWVHHFGGTEPMISLDPGMLAHDTYNIKPFKNHKREKKVIMFGVSDPASMLPHSDTTEGVVCGDIDFYINTLSILAKKHEIRMFTNGEDQDYLEKVAAAIEGMPAKLKANISIMPRPFKPTVLINQIAEADVLIAHRMHANIMSYSLGIPHIGLGWDEKLKSLFKIIERPEYIITSNKDNTKNVVALVDKALEEGINKATHKRVLAASEQGIIALAKALTAKVK